MNTPSNDINDLASALLTSFKKKNTLTIGEFRKFEPLFKKNTDHATKEYADLCTEWSFRVSLYDPVIVIDPATQATIWTLPPMFNRVDTITKFSNATAVINKFEHANISNHPLRTDGEEALDLFKSTVYHAQDKQRLQDSAILFEEIASAAGFTPQEDPAATIDETVKKLKWD